MREDAKSRPGVSLVELLACLAFIATLLTLLMPAIQSVRAGMARSKCADHKRQLGLALAMYMEAARGLPPAPNPPYPGGWGRELLPFMEERPLFEALDLRQPLAAAVNAAAALGRGARRTLGFMSSTRPRTSTCPGRDQPRWTAAS